MGSLDGQKSFCHCSARLALNEHENSGHQKTGALAVGSRVSKLARVEFERYPYPALLKEPAHFWDEVFIANEAYVLGEVTHPRIRRKLAYDAATHRLFLEYIEGETLDDLVRQGITLKDRDGRIASCKAWPKRWRTCTRASFAGGPSSTTI